MGPCKIVPREGDGEMAAVELRKCRYLEQSGCTASCVNFCKVTASSRARVEVGEGGEGDTYLVYNGLDAGLNLAGSTLSD